MTTVDRGFLGDNAAVLAGDVETLGLGHCGALGLADSGAHLATLLLLETPPSSTSSSLLHQSTLGAHSYLVATSNTSPTPAPASKPPGLSPEVSPAVAGT